MDWRREERLFLDEVVEKFVSLTKGEGLSLRELSEFPRSVLWTPECDVSLSQAMLLTGKPVVLEGSLDRRVEERLVSEDMVNMARGLRGYAEDPKVKAAILIPLIWNLINRLVRERYPTPDEVLDHWRRLVSEMRSVTGGGIEEVLLWALGFEPQIGTGRVSGELARELFSAIVVPVVLARTFKSFSPRLSGEAWSLTRPRTIRFPESIEVSLPKSRRDSLDLLRVSRDLSDTYHEVRSEIVGVMDAAVEGRFKDLSKLREVLDQLSKALDDWTIRRRLRLMGAKLRSHRLTICGFYPSAPKGWISQLVRRGMIVESQEEAPPSFPWPFSEKGVSYLRVESC